MKLSIALVGILLSIAFGGCQNLKDFSSSNNPKRVFYESWNSTQAGAFTNGEYRRKYDQFVESGEIAKAVGERNAKLELFLGAVDTYYNRNKNFLITGRASTATGFDIVQLGLTGSASLASGGTSNVLAAIATAIHGTRLSIDKNLFQDQSTMLIAAKMDQLRSAKLAEIERKKIDPTVSGYSLDAAMRDGIEYYYAGTMNAALLALFNETGKLKAVADKEIEDVSKKNYENVLKNNQTEADKKALEVKKETEDLAEKTAERLEK